MQNSLTFPWPWKKTRFSLTVAPTKLMYQWVAQTNNNGILGSAFSLIFFYIYIIFYHLVLLGSNSLIRFSREFRKSPPQYSKENSMAFVLGMQFENNIQPGKLPLPHVRVLPNNQQVRKIIFFRRDPDDSIWEKHAWVLFLWEAKSK